MMSISGGIFSVTVHGNSGRLVQASLNRVDWDNVCLPTPPFIWSDGGTGNFPRRVLSRSTDAMMFIFKTG